MSVFNTSVVVVDRVKADSKADLETKAPWETLVSQGPKVRTSVNKCTSKS